MKAKKVIALIIFLASHYNYAAIIRHSMTSVTEQKVAGRIFKHVMTSGNASKDEFFIDGYAFDCQAYHDQLELAVKKEHEEQLAFQERAIRNRIECAHAMQMQIATKLLQNSIAQILALLQKIQNPALAQFFLFTPTTITSFDQLMQLQHFIEQVELSMKSKIEQEDFEGLYLLHSKLEIWPARLEKFFQDTLQHAIKKSDDTTMLKELLSLVSELS